MGARKHNRAEAIKEARKNVAIAHLNNVPTSPYKMRLVADMIRGQKVELALHALQYSTKVRKLWVSVLTVFNVTV